MSKSVAVFLNTNSGEMSVWDSLQSFEQSNPDYDTNTVNDQGDTIVQTRDKPWGKTLGYIQVREVNNA